MKTKYNAVYLFLLLLFAGCDQNGDFTSGIKPEDIETNMVKIENGNSSFYIGKYEVTQAEWQAVMGYNPSRIKGANRPVESVTQNEVVDFISELNRLTGQTYALPTYDQWVYAARGGSDGEIDLDATAWYAGNSGGKPHPVGEKEPNGYGLYDMCGNVMELVQYGNPKYCYYGGSWSSEKDRCSPTAKVQLLFNEYERVPNVGFRLVKNEETGKEFGSAGKWSLIENLNEWPGFSVTLKDNTLISQFKNKQAAIEFWKDNKLYRTNTDLNIYVKPTLYGNATDITVYSNQIKNNLDYGMYQIRVVTGNYHTPFQYYNFYEILTNAYEADVTENSASVGGSYEFQGKPEIVEWGIRYSKKNSYPVEDGTDVTTYVCDATKQTGSCSLTGLLSSTTYYYCTYVKAKSVFGGNEEKLYHSEVRSFTTK